MTIPYGIGPDAEVFKYSLFLVFCNRVVAATIAAITLVVSFGDTQGTISDTMVLFVYWDIMPGT